MYTIYYKQTPESFTRSMTIRAASEQDAINSFYIDYPTYYFIRIS